MTPRRGRMGHPYYGNIPINPWRVGGDCFRVTLKISWQCTDHKKKPKKAKNFFLLNESWYRFIIRFILFDSVGTYLVP